MKTHLVALSLALGLTLPSVAAQASLIGDTMGCSITGGGTFTCSTPTAVVVDPGVEFQIGDLPGTAFFDIDFRSSDVLFTTLTSNSLGFTIVNLTDLTTAFTGASLLSSSGVNGFSAANVSLSGGTLVVNLIGTSSDPGATIDIALATPEPTSLALLGVGLFGFGLSRRRRGQRAASV